MVNVMILYAHKIYAKMINNPRCFVLFAHMPKCYHKFPLARAVKIIPVLSEQSSQNRSLQPKILSDFLLSRKLLV